METFQSKVALFHKVFGHPHPSTPITNLPSKLADLRYNLIQEELTELKDALNADDSKETLDALGDIMYVVMGYRVVCGFSDKNDTNFRAIRDYRDIYFIESVSFQNRVDFVCKNYIKSLDSLLESIKIISGHNNMQELDLYLNTLAEKTYDFSCYLGYNLDEAYNRIQESNMSKLCKTEDIAKETVEKYKVTNPDWIVEYRESEYGFTVFNKETGKILKSCRFAEPDFTGLY